MYSKDGHHSEPECTIVNGKMYLKLNKILLGGCCVEDKCIVIEVINCLLYLCNKYCYVNSVHSIILKIEKVNS